MCSSDLLYPLVQLVGLVLLVGILVTMGLDKGDWRYSWIVGAPFLTLLSIAYFARNSQRARAAAVTAAIQEPRP